MDSNEFDLAISCFGHGQDCYLFENVLTSSVGVEFEIRRTDKL